MTKSAIVTGAANGIVDAISTALSGRAYRVGVMDIYPE